MALKPVAIECDRFAIQNVDGGFVLLMQVRFGPAARRNGGRAAIVRSRGWSASWRGSEAQLVKGAVDITPCNGRDIAQKSDGASTLCCEIFRAAIVEGGACAFQDIDQIFVDLRRFDRAHGIDHLVLVRTINIGVNDLLGIANNSNVRGCV